ncbi:MAG TPA: hypothetical protein VMT20_04185, partial [Terriglobia bacterium]|nr:hypothetical protein [Terriglobia bacterium]
DGAWNVLRLAVAFFQQYRSKRKRRWCRLLRVISSGLCIRDSVRETDGADWSRERRWAGTCLDTRESNASQHLNGNRTGHDTRGNIGRESIFNASLEF